MIVMVGLMGDKVWPHLVIYITCQVDRLVTDSNGRSHGGYISTLSGLQTGSW